MNKQLDIFGNEVEVHNIPHKRKGRPKYRTMQEIYGTINGKTCKTCKYCVKYILGYKGWYKCEKWIISSSESTDIRMKDIACKKYEEGNNE